MKKNQKIKTNPIPPGVLSGLPAPGRRPDASTGMAGEKQVVKEASAKTVNSWTKAVGQGSLQGRRPGARGGMPPGGDPAFLTFWFFCVKTKERKDRAKTR